MLLQVIRSYGVHSPKAYFRQRNFDSLGAHDIGLFSPDTIIGRSLLSEVNARPTVFLRGSRGLSHVILQVWDLAPYLTEQ